MDFRQTVQPNGRPVSAPASAAPVAPAPMHETGKKAKDTKSENKLFRILNIAILLGIAILVAGIAFAFTRPSGGAEFKYVDSSKYQAVLLNNGQVYFGKIGSLNSSYVELSNIYYLTQTAGTGTGSAATATNGNYTLVKLGCQQIHDPSDQMLINRDQVTFWENLVDSGKVVTSIAQFQKQNPKGPDCSQVSTQTQASNTAGTQGGTTGTGTGTTTTPKQ